METDNAPALPATLDTGIIEADAVDDAAIAALAAALGFMEAGLAPSGGTALKLAERYLAAGGPLYVDACQCAHRRLHELQGTGRADLDRLHLGRLLEDARRARTASPAPEAA